MPWSVASRNKASRCKNSGRFSVSDSIQDQTAAVRCVEGDAAASGEKTLEQGLCNSDASSSNGLTGTTTAALRDELELLQRRLDEWHRAAPTRLLETELVKPSRWHARDPHVFSSPEFKALKESISQSCGNVAPVVVKPVGDAYEVILGGLRVQACRDLGLSVLAVVKTDGVSDPELFQMSERENRNCIPMSCLEQGRRYLMALKTGLFPSARKIAQYVGVSHTWVNDAIRVADLPAAVTLAFSDPRVIQPKHAIQIFDAIKKDSKEVLRRSSELIQMASEAVMPAAMVVKYLCGSDAELPLKRKLLDDEKPELGDWQHDGKQWLTVRIRTQDPDRLIPEIRRVARGVAGAGAGHGNKVSKLPNFESDPEVARGPNDRRPHA